MIRFRILVLIIIVIIIINKITLIVFVVGYLSSFDRNALERSIRIAIQITQIQKDQRRFCCEIEIVYASTLICFFLVVLYLCSRGR